MTHLVIEGLFAAVLSGAVYIIGHSFANGWNRFCDMKDTEKGEDQ